MRGARRSRASVITTAGGELSEMFVAEVCGDVFPAGDVAALRGILLHVVDRWPAHLPPPKRSDVHSAEIDRVYQSVLAAGTP